MKALILVSLMAFTAGAADILVGGQGIQSSDPWCGS